MWAVILPLSRRTCRGVHKEAFTFLEKLTKRLAVHIPGTICHNDLLFHERPHPNPLVSHRAVVLLEPHAGPEQQRLIQGRVVLFFANDCCAKEPC